uniref:Si:dkey-12j5.1 n=1 Tax=Cyprinodon variegatus TaxID=28743 RepID=A0A3Q2GGY6_CYPVA
MGGQAKTKKKNKPKKKDRFVDLSPQERMRVRMHEKAKKKTAEKYSVQQLLEKTQEYMDSFDFEMASLFCQRALDVDSNNLQALDLLGNICSELGDMEKAKSISFLILFFIHIYIFLRAIDLSPDVGHSKYMYLGQIHTGLEAVDYYTRGIQVLLSALGKQDDGATGTTDEKDEVPSTKDVSVAYCSLAEIYLTDLCMEEGAADKCREFIEKALQYHHDNPEALQLMASYLFSTERNQEGKEYLLKSVGMWLPAYKQSVASSATEEEGNEIPPYESRITTAKLLIESEEYEMAVDVLEGLLEEDDEVVQVSSIHFPAISILKGDTFSTFISLQLFSKLQCDDQPMLEHAEQLLGELGGEMEAEDEDPAVVDDFEPCSDDEDDDTAEDAMEH